nr:PREDICTED: uncharacterized protein LOC107398350 isoform X2 [Tribolium castaneum]|eukprot:XP_015837646.1 PREDICTED: uncharacterized protein LOC107398350 isoform X2 [Tribolium castaneum]
MCGGIYKFVRLPTHGESHTTQKVHQRTGTTQRRSNTRHTEIPRPHVHLRALFLSPEVLRIQTKIGLEKLATCCNRKD